MSDQIDHYRAEFPITQQYTFLSHAAVSSPSRRVSAAVQHAMQQFLAQPFTVYLPEIMTLNEELIERIVRLIGARGRDEVVLMPNTAAGLNTVAASLPLQAGDNILVLDGDYPANVYPWWNLTYRGILTKMVPSHEGGLDLNRLEQRIDRRTRVIALSTVMFATGFRNDIAAVGQLCKERNIFFVVDAIQSLGAFSMDVQSSHIDALACGSQKWLLSTPGSGFLYCRRELLDTLVPGAYVGASSVTDSYNYLDYNFTSPPGAERFNLGTPNIAGMVALHSAIGLLLEVGIEAIADRIGNLVDLLIRSLLERGYTLAASADPSHRSGIVVVRTPHAEHICQRLVDAHVIVTSRGTGVRIAPHFYNTDEEILHCVDLLAQADHT
ncbi:MAG: aminotransferase class V-fold PLP-dependent enzyme [Chloroflexaceae bacterium]|nr:aminotransferase class V-fold PLP-dependent enzyme [Chloroflexaceae bacterium]